LPRCAEAVEKVALPLFRVFSALACDGRSLVLAPSPGAEGSFLTVSQSCKETLAAQQMKFPQRETPGELTRCGGPSLAPYRR